MEQNVNCPERYSKPCFNLYVSDTKDTAPAFTCIQGDTLEECTRMACNLFHSTYGSIYLKCVKCYSNEMVTCFIMERV